MLRKILNYFKKPRWYVAEAYTFYWEVSSSIFHKVQKPVFYKLEFSPDLNEYRLQWEGHHGDQHSMYGEMLQRVAELNQGNPPKSEPSSLGTMFDNLLNLEDPESILILTMPLDENKSRAFEQESTDEKLIKAIEDYIPALKENGVEIFEQKNNILITEQGYYLAVYSKDITIINDEDEDSKE